MFDADSEEHNSEPLVEKERTKRIATETGISVLLDQKTGLRYGHVEQLLSEFHIYKVSWLFHRSCV